MKKIFTLVIKKCLPLILFICTQVKVWALDTTTAGTIDKTGNIFSRPWIWIVVIAIVAIKLLGPLTDDNKDFVIIRKKTPRKKAA